MGSRTMVVTDYHKKRTMGNVQKEGTMKFPTSGHVGRGHVIV